MYLPTNVIMVPSVKYAFLVPFSFNICMPLQHSKQWEKARFTHQSLVDGTCPGNFIFEECRHCRIDWGTTTFASGHTDCFLLYFMVENVQSMVFGGHPPNYIS